jgi:hypothetical protein
MERLPIVQPFCFGAASQRISPIGLPRELRKRPIGTPHRVRTPDCGIALLPYIHVPVASEIGEIYGLKKVIMIGPCQTF